MRARFSVQPPPHAQGSVSTTSSTDEESQGAETAGPVATAAAQTLVLPVGWEIQLDEVLAK